MANVTENLNHGTFHDFFFFCCCFIVVVAAVALEQFFIMLGYEKRAEINIKANCPTDPRYKSFCMPRPLQRYLIGKVWMRVWVCVCVCVFPLPTQFVWFLLSVCISGPDMANISLTYPISPSTIITERNTEKKDLFSLFGFIRLCQHKLLLIRFCRFLACQFQAFCQMKYEVLTALQQKTVDKALSARSSTMKNINFFVLSYRKCIFG